MVKNLAELVEFVEKNSDELEVFLKKTDNTWLGTIGELDENDIDANFLIRTLFLAKSYYSANKFGKSEEDQILLRHWYFAYKKINPKNDINYFDPDALNAEFGKIIENIKVKDAIIITKSLEKGSKNNTARVSLNIEYSLFERKKSSEISMFSKESPNPEFEASNLSGRIYTPTLLGIIGKRIYMAELHGFNSSAVIDTLNNLLLRGYTNHKERLTKESRKLIEECVNNLIRASVNHYDSFCHRNREGGRQKDYAMAIRRDIFDLLKDIPGIDIAKASGFSRLYSGVKGTTPYYNLNGNNIMVLNNALRGISSIPQLSDFEELIYAAQTGKVSYQDARERFLLGNVVSYDFETKGVLSHPTEQVMDLMVREKVGSMRTKVALDKLRELGYDVSTDQLDETNLLLSVYRTIRSAKFIWERNKENIYMGRGEEARLDLRNHLEKCVDAVKIYKEQLKHSEAKDTGREGYGVLDKKLMIADSFIQGLQGMQKYLSGGRYNAMIRASQMSKISMAYT